MIEFYEGNGKHIKIDNISDIFISVKDYGAVGDGYANDTKAIQKALNSIRYIGGTIYFPRGTYCIDSPILVYSNQTIMGDGAILFRNSDTNNMMRNYNTGTSHDGIGGYDATKNVTIKGLVFDGNSTNFQGDVTMLGFEHSKNIVIDSCVFKWGSGEWHDIEINSTYNTSIKNCLFLEHRRTSENACRVLIDSYDNASTWVWKDGIVDNTRSYFVDIHNCYFDGYHGSPPAIGNHSETKVRNIRIHDNTFENFLNTRGTIIFKNSESVDVYDNTFTNCNIGVSSKSVTRDNRFERCSTPYSASTIHYNNVIDDILER